MNQPEKWLDGVTADSKVRPVARRALAARLERVAKHLKRAAKQSRDQAHQIHKLRTWCRRCSAAIELFRPLLPKKEGKWFAHQLKRIRQAAGKMRDLDVMLGQATHDSALAEELKRQRDKARRPLEKLHQRLLNRPQFAKRQQRLLQSIHRPKKRLGDWGAPRVRQRSAAIALLAEGRLKALVTAHEFRIGCKELRYVLEIVGGALPVAAIKTYLLLGDLQRRIGVICDLVAAETMYRKLLPKVSPPHRQLLLAAIAQAKTQRSKTHQAFLRWWTPGRRAAFRATLGKAGLL